MHVPDELRARLLRIARDSLLAVAARVTPPVPDLRPGDPAAPAFVTLHLRGALRGCTGTLAADRPLPSLVSALAESTATSDPRFPPVTPAEATASIIEISVLTPPRSALVDEVEAGVHGVIVSRGWSRGILLPQVATEHRWTREDLLGAACRKAGLRPDAWREPGLSLETFEAIVFRESRGQSGGLAATSRRGAILP